MKKKRESMKVHVHQQWHKHEQSYSRCTSADCKSSMVSFIPSDRKSRQSEGLELGTEERARSKKTCKRVSLAGVRARQPECLLNAVTRARTPATPTVHQRRRDHEPPF